VSITVYNMQKWPFNSSISSWPHPDIIDKYGFCFSWGTK